MSWGTCYAGSNNIHFDFPPIMSDGRNFSKWQPGATINQEIRQENGIKSNWQYRKYLTENADSVIKANQLEACDECCYCPSSRTGQSVPNSPFLYKSCMEKSQPYGYADSDLKNLYLSSSQLQARMIAPAITQEEILQQRMPNPN
jgi:hypothetical protein|tara:strand:+ start:5562 stop:5996 length:435 start_codon:yes stop_codon:yes gene_type:complete